MVCKGICVRHKAMKPGATGRYSTGQKRCQVCEIFLKWDGLWCPCCGYRLRSSPRNSKFKAELRASKEMDKAKISVLYKQPPIQDHQKHIAQFYTSSHLSKIIKNISHTEVRLILTEV